MLFSHLYISTSVWYGHFDSYIIGPFNTWRVEDSCLCTVHTVVEEVFGYIIYNTLYKYSIARKYCIENGTYISLVNGKSIQLW